MELVLRLRTPLPFPPRTVQDTLPPIGSSQRPNQTYSAKVRHGSKTQPISTYTTSVGKKSMSGFSVFCPSNKRRPAPSSRAWSCQGDEIEPDGMEVFPKSQVPVARFLSGCCFMQLALGSNLPSVQLVFVAGLADMEPQSSTKSGD